MDTPIKFACWNCQGAVEVLGLELGESRMINCPHCESPMGIASPDKPPVNRFPEFIGQLKIKERLWDIIHHLQRPETPLRNVLLIAPQGYGKTFLSALFIREACSRLSKRIFVIESDDAKTPSDILSSIQGSSPGDFLFFPEIENLSEASAFFVKELTSAHNRRIVATALNESEVLPFLKICFSEIMTFNPYSIGELKHIGLQLLRVKELVMEESDTLSIAESVSSPFSMAWIIDLLDSYMKSRNLGRIATQPILEGFLETYKSMVPVGPEEYIRPPIPRNVRNEVWNRDGGKCVKCGSRIRIEYDHIIPISKGGSNTARNIELLCEACNRAKSNKIQ